MITRADELGGSLHALLRPGPATPRCSALIVACSNPIWEGTQPTGPAADELIRELDEPCPRPGSRVLRGRIVRIPIAVQADAALAEGSWRQIAMTFVRRLGIGTRTRWVAIHLGRGAPTAVETLHLFVNRVRTDGRVLTLDRNAAQLRAAQAEVDAMQRRIATGTPVALGSVALTGLEIEQLREGDVSDLADLDRFRVATSARAVAAVARSEGEFVALLRGSGLLLHPRTAGTGEVAVCDYSVALFQPSTHRLTWFDPGALSACLTLPALRAHWGHAANTSTAMAAAWFGTNVVDAVCGLASAGSSLAALRALRAAERGIDRAGPGAHRLAAAAGLLACAAHSVDHLDVRRRLIRAWWACDQYALRASAAVWLVGATLPPPLAAAGDLGPVLAGVCRVLLGLRDRDDLAGAPDRAGVADRPATALQRNAVHFARRLIATAVPRGAGRGLGPVLHAISAAGHQLSQLDQLRASENVSD